jgi:hypothetical protein
MNIITWDVVHGKLWLKMYLDHELGGIFDLARLNKLLISTISAGSIYTTRKSFSSYPMADQKNNILRRTHFSPIHPPFSQQLSLSPLILLTPLHGGVLL